MKKLLWLLVILCTLAGLSVAQTTTVTATVVAPDGNAFKNGTVTASFLPSNGLTQCNQYNINGATFPCSVSGSMNGSGTFVIVLTDDHLISPSGGLWKFSVCPTVTAPCTSTVQDVFGASINLSSAISLAVAPITGNGTPFPRFYQDSEVTPESKGGSVYYNVTSNILRYYNATVWSDIGSGSGGGLSGVQTGFGLKVYGGVNVGLLDTCTTSQVLVWGGSSWGCGANGSGLSGLTTGFFPVATGASSVANSLCDQGITTANVMTCSDTGGLALAGAQYTFFGGFGAYPATPGANLSEFVFGPSGVPAASRNNGPFTPFLFQGGVAASDVIPGSLFDTSNIPNMASTYGYELTANKGQANGYAGLDSGQILQNTCDPGNANCVNPSSTTNGTFIYWHGTGSTCPGVGGTRMWCTFLGNTSGTAFPIESSTGVLSWQLVNSLLGDPGSNGVVKRTAAGTTALAGFADIVALWITSGTCNSTTVLFGDGHCAAGGGGGGSPAGSNFDLQVNNSGSFGAITTPTSPNGIPQSIQSTPSGGVGTAWAPAIPGVAIDHITSTTPTIPITDDMKIVTLDNSSPIAVAGFALANNYAFGLYNINVGLATYTPASGTVNGNATALIPSRWFGFHYTDNTNTQLPIMPTIQAFPNCVDNAGQHLNFTAATGIINCGNTDNPPRNIITTIPSSDTISAAGTFATTVAVPSGSFAVGSLLVIRAHGTFVTTATASPKMNFRVNGGGTTGLCPALGTNIILTVSITNDTWNIECFVQINTTGTPGTAITWGSQEEDISTAQFKRSLFTTSGSTVAYTTTSSQNVTIEETGTMVAGQTFTIQALTVNTAY